VSLFEGLHFDFIRGGRRANQETPKTNFIQTVEASVTIAEQRLTHDPENTFHKGWLKTFLEKDARAGFEMMRFESNFSEKNMEDFLKHLR
jgi:hypothetical protein